MKSKPKPWCVLSLTMPPLPAFPSTCTVVFRQQKAKAAVAKPKPWQQKAKAAAAKPKPWQQKRAKPANANANAKSDPPVEIFAPPPPQSSSSSSRYAPSPRLCRCSRDYHCYFTLQHASALGASAAANEAEERYPKRTSTELEISSCS